MELDLLALMRTRIRDIKDPDYGLPHKPQGDPLIIVMQLEEIAKKLDQIQETLNRIEERQKRTTAMVENVKEKAPVVGSFASTDTGEK
jgi:hypothetical protein